jgi:hypothetical protein
MEIPWSTPAAARVPAGQDIVILGSRFELTSAWRSPAFLGYALRIWLQARRSPGIMGVSLRAQPLRATFWTLSAWSSQAALRDFARADPHRSIVARVRPWAKKAVLQTWTVPGGEAGPTALDPAALWEQAEARISSASRGVAGTC